VFLILKHNHETNARGGGGKKPRATRAYFLPPRAPFAGPGVFEAVNRSRGDWPRDRYGPRERKIFIFVYTLRQLFSPYQAYFFAQPRASFDMPFRAKRAQFPKSFSAFTRARRVSPHTRLTLSDTRQHHQVWA
jgi:hypothetical protein